MDKSWGKATWYLFHTLAIKVKEDKFHIIKYELWEFISKICYNLPCPICRQHAIQSIKTANIKVILTNKNTLKNFLYTFHNVVNKRKSYAILNETECDNLYKTANIDNIVNYFSLHFSKNSNNMQTLTDDFHRKLIIKNLKTWIQLNRNKF